MMTNRDLEDIFTALEHAAQHCDATGKHALKALRRQLTRLLLPGGRLNKRLAEAVYRRVYPYAEGDVGRWN
ncbi:MAG: hypothetical protein ACRD5H_00045 [Nitrososphaerales archaeon]